MTRVSSAFAGQAQEDGCKFKASLFCTGNSRPAKKVSKTLSQSFKKGGWGGIECFSEYCFLFLYS